MSHKNSPSSEGSEGDKIPLNLRSLIFWAAPVLLSAIFWLTGLMISADGIQAIMLQSILLSSPPWLMLIWPIWSLVIALRRGGQWKWLFLLTPWWSGVPEIFRGEAKGDLQILVANVNAYTGSPEQLQKKLVDLSADVVILLERRIDDIPGLPRVADDFSESRSRPSHHTAVYCKGKCEAWISPEYGSSKMKMPLALVRLPMGLCLIGIHAPPPVPIDASGLKPYIRKIAENIGDGRILGDWEVCRKGDPVLLMGDMNAVPHSWAHKKLLSLGLEDQRAWTGVWGGSWPMGGGFAPLPVFRLDHVLSSGVELNGVLPVKLPDSDHIGLRVWLQSSSAGQ